MIKGITHDDDGIINKNNKYKGKISTGFAPGEGPNKGNYPSQAGFFRLLKEQTVSKRIGTGASQKVVQMKEWVLNEVAQKSLEDETACTNGQPRKLEIICLNKSPEDMWESSMSSFNKSDGLVCKSHGEGTVAKKLQYTPAGDREWIERSFDGKKGCSLDKCPEYKGGTCKPHGILKCFPTSDLSVNPYRYETNSVNTIVGIESSLNNFYELLKAAHLIRQAEAGVDSLPFDGLFGSKLLLVHKKIKSGGKDVFITELHPTQEFNDSVLEPIKREIQRKNENAKKIGANGLSLLNQAGQSLISKVDVEDEDLIEEGDISEVIDVKVEDIQTFGDKSTDVAKSLLGNKDEEI